MEAIKYIAEEMMEPTACSVFTVHAIKQLKIKTYLRHHLWDTPDGTVNK